MIHSQPVELSIVLALKAPRTEDPLEGLIGWTQRQTCRRDRFEVIVAANGDHPELEQRARGVLAPHDRLLSPRPRLGAFALLDLAARAARGRWIHVCELHGIPEPECAEELLAHLSENDSPAAMAWSGTRGEGPLARGQARYYRELMAASDASMEAPTVPLRGVAFRRDVLDKIGGIPGDYSLYADRILAAALQEAGVRMSVARRARYDHFDQTRLRGLRQDLSHYSWGEIRYRAGNDAAYCDRHLGRPAEWAERDGYRRPIARQRRRAAGRAWRTALRGGRIRPAWTLGREWLRHAERGGFGAWGESAVAWLVTALHELRFLAAGRDEDARYRAMCDIMESYPRSIRLWCIGRHVRDTSLPPARRSASNGLPPDAQRVGFHRAEVFAGETFHWTEPSAMLRLALGPGDHRVRIRTRGLRPGLRYEPLGILWNGQAIADDRIARDAEGIDFAVPRGLCRPGGEQWLNLACAPLAIPADSAETRRLGWPIFSLDVQPGP